jgi:mannose-6-phosphate isomerase-like protein (cupin superfamily)
MSEFQLIAAGIDTVPLMLELARNADLWDANPERRTYPGSPHRDMVDITARYMPHDQVTLATRATEHRNVFWPAWHRLPALRPLVFSLMTRCQAVELGSIIITKLPPGKSILPHSDAGSWSASHYNCKAHVAVAGLARVQCADETCVFNAGEVWTFDNLQVHSVQNVGGSDRISVIVSMRAE